MSAIAGLVDLDGRTDRDRIVTRMLDRMAHRGPDGRGERAMGSASFGHLLLHTTEQSFHEQLPFREGEYLLTAATRLDDRPNDSTPDSAHVFEIFRKHGNLFSARLDGDFAIAIYDNASGKLFLARDHFGVKPLYYFHAPGKFLIFASQIRALFAHPEVPRRLNKTRLAQFWLGQLPDQEMTFYDGICRVPAAHTLTFNEAGLSLRRYWTLSDDEFRLGSSAEYEEAFRHHFTEAVRKRLRTPFKIGFQMSGGLDSTAVACVGRDLLRAQNQLPAATYSDVFPTIPSADERRYIEAALAQGGFDPHFIEADRETSPLAEFDTFLQFEDEGNYNTNANLVLVLHRRMQQDGVRVCLDGFDGDTTVGHGRFLFAELAAKNEWDSFDRELSAFSALNRKEPALAATLFAGPALRQTLIEQNFPAYVRNLRAAAPHFQRSIPRLLFETAVRPILPNVLPHSRFLQKLIDPALARSMRLAQRAREFARENPGHHLNERSLQKTLLLSGGFAEALERFDHAAEYFHLENRHPFLDRRLVEFCVGLPTSQKLSAGFTRSILRRSLAYILPPEVHQRPAKTDFTVAFRKGLFERDGAKLEKWVLCSNDLRDFLQKAALHDAYADAREGRLRDTDLFVLFRVLTSIRWVRHTGLELR